MWRMGLLVLLVPLVLVPVRGEDRPLDLQQLRDLLRRGAIFVDGIPEKAVSEPSDDEIARAVASLGRRLLSLLHSPRLQKSEEPLRARGHQKRAPLHRRRENFVDDYPVIFS